MHTEDLLFLGPFSGRYNLQVPSHEFGAAHAYCWWIGLCKNQRCVRFLILRCVLNFLFTYLVHANWAQMAVTGIKSGGHTHADWPISYLTKFTAKLINLRKKHKQFLHFKSYMYKTWQCIQFYLCANRQVTNNFKKFCMPVAATLVQFACDRRLNGLENWMCGHQSHSKCACPGGYNTAKPPVFGHDAGITNI